MSTGLYRSARRLRVALWAGVVLAPLLTLAGVIGAWRGGSGLVGTTLKTAGLPLAWASALAIVQSLLIATALYQLAVLLGAVRLEQLFPPQASRRFGRFAAMLFLAVLVHGPIPALLLALLVPAGQPRGIFLDLADLLALLVTSVFWMVARLLDAASRLEDDHRSIV